MGGYGLIDWAYERPVGRTRVVTVKNDMIFQIQEKAATRVESTFPYWLRGADFNSIINERLNTMTVDDDVPVVNRELRRKVLFPENVRWRAIPGYETAVGLSRWCEMLSQVRRAETFAAWQKIDGLLTVGTFGAFTDLRGHWERFREAAPSLGLKLADFLERHGRFDSRIKQLRQRGLTTGQSVAWLLGDVPFDLPGGVNPIAIWFRNKLVLWILSRQLSLGYKLDHRTLARKSWEWGLWASGAVKTAPIYNKIYKN